ncbi:MAG: SpoIIE family protein phosphatase [Aquimonas sp.]|nr:SpoIIE family protein phosphatase [Xanthomonadales bacterium]MCC6504686.1 SpoIIE family protein phosphatase [Aquimonas sp.]
MSTPSAEPRERTLLSRLADLSQRLALSLDLEQTLRQVARLIAESMNAEASAVFLLGDTGERLVCRACSGPVDIEGLTLRADEGLVGRAISRQQCEIVRDALADPDFAGSRWGDMAGFRPRSVLSAPLLTAHGPIGALQVLNKCCGSLFDDEDVDALRVLAAPTALAINHARLAAQVVQQDRLKKELGMARRLQRSLLPKRRRGSFPLRALNFPAREISGDFYDFFDLPDGRIAFTVGDVAGKGLDAAFVMVRCASLLRWAGKEGLRPGHWLARVNDELGEAIAPGMFVCAVAGTFDPWSRSLCWASAGFPPLLRMARDGTQQRFEADGPPLGILPGMHFGEQQVALDGASMYLFSDGLTDVRGTDGGMLGMEGVSASIAAMRDLPVEARLRALVAGLRQMTVTDDTTLMVIEGGEPLWLRYRFLACPNALQGMRHALDAALRAQNVEEALRASLVLAVDEACANVIRHAYGAGAEGEIELCVSPFDDGIRLVILDDAPPVDPTHVRPRNLDECRPGGLGVCFIDALMDDWRLTPLLGGGNRLQMFKRWPLAAEETT